MYADVAVWTRMFYVTEIRCQISPFCFHEVLNETFRTSSIDAINDCRHNFSFLLSTSEMIEIRKANLESKFNKCNSLMYYCGL